MTRTVVLNGHTLGVVYQISDDLFELQILHSSVLRGSPIVGSLASALGVLSFDPKTDNFREATEQDFKDFNVVSHPSYFERL